MSIKRILYCTKFRDLSLQALKELFVLKKAGLEEIILLHIIPREDVSYVFPFGYLEEEANRLKEEAELRFEVWGKEIRAFSLNYRTIIKVGDPVYDIPAVCEEEKVDLLVLGKKKRETLFVGSRTKEILKQVKVPTLVFKYKLKEEDLEIENKNLFQRPLVAIDFSPPSLRALEFFYKLKDMFERGMVVYVIPSAKVEGSDKMRMKALEEEMSQKLENLLKNYFENTEKVERLILLGEPQEIVLDLASEKEATLVILGRSEKTFIDRLFLGSVANYVLDRARTPVLIVP
ncbi:MAG: universal stress protein [Thermodesulfobacterium sp.]|jgi:nucleotide-binding universal stress UspA family protein|nr:universal stress protein [Thermodesulfobacterium sp.]